MGCNDPKCPIHGQVKMRGSDIEAVVVSDKADKTVIVERPYTIFLKKYERSIRKHSRISAHNPPCLNAKMGDKVIVSETRRLSKTKSFAVSRIIRRGSQ